jgi:general secretion pathway protein M
MSAAAPSALSQAVSARWAALGSRERVLVGSAMALIAAALLWWVGLSPALTQIKQARAAAPQLDAQLQLMRAQANEASTLKAQRALSYDESLRSLENALKTLGTGATLSATDARASVTLKAVSGDALAQWLAQVRANARLVPSELRLQKTAAVPATATTAAPAAATWDGTVVLNLPNR